MSFLTRLFKGVPKTPEDQHNDTLIADWQTMKRSVWFNRYIAKPLRVNGWSEDTIDGVAILDQKTIASLQWEDATLYADLEYARQDALTAAIKKAYGNTHKVTLDLLYVENLDSYGKALKQARTRIRSTVTAQMKDWKSRGVDKALLQDVLDRVYGK